MKKLFMPLYGRLGNILFDLGAALTLCKKQDRELYITDLPGYDTKLCIKENADFFSWLKYEKKSKDCVEYIEDDLQHHVDIGNPHKDLYIQGFFQSEKYMDKTLVRNFFKISDELKKNVYKDFGDLSDAVSINVRRGDFLQLKNIFVTPTSDWYMRCYEKYFNKKKVIISSDDIKWVKNNIKIPNAIYLENKGTLESLYICSECKHHIINESTFSWWCAWLNEQEDSKIVCMDKCWADGCNIEYKDRIPERWFREPILNDYEK